MIDAPPTAVHVAVVRSVGAGPAPLVRLQDVQPPLQIPQTDISVEVIGQLPLRMQLQDLTRLLSLRQSTRGPYRFYPPTILELIMLVKRNPAKPRGRAWNSIRALTIGYSSEKKEVSVEYCVDHCDTDPESKQPHPRRKMVSYSAAEDLVMTRLKKKLDELARR